MNRIAWNRLALLVAFAATVTACQLRSMPLYTRGEFPPTSRGFASPLPAPSKGQVESPLAIAVESPDCVGVAGLDGFQMVRRVDMQITGPDSSTEPTMTLYILRVMRARDGWCDSHGLTARLDPQTGETVVTGEGYAVGDLSFAYCDPCALPGRGTWQVSRRTTNVDPLYTSGALGATPTNLGPLAVDQLLAQSSVVGEETMNGFATIHRRFTDRQALAPAVRWQMDADPNYGLAVTKGQVDFWLTAGEQRIVRLRFQAEGTTRGVDRWGVPLRFALEDEFNFTAAGGTAPIVVPSAVLAAVEMQRKALR